MRLWIDVFFSLISLFNKSSTIDDELRDQIIIGTYTGTGTEKRVVPVYNSASKKVLECVMVWQSNYRQFVPSTSISTFNHIICGGIMVKAQPMIGGITNSSNPITPIIVAELDKTYFRVTTRDYSQAQMNSTGAIYTYVAIS